MDELNARRHYKYVYAGLGALIGIVVGMVFPALIYKVNSALYKRDGLEELMIEYLGAAKFNEIMTDEMLMVAYDYNS